ncbi:MAG: cupin domain-containing protein [Pseudomonadota bacterium]
MTFWNLGALELEPFRPGILSRAELGDSLIMVCMEISADKEDTGHTHPFDQCGVVLEGRIEMVVEGERRTLNANESYFIRSGQNHGWKTFDTPVKLLDITAKPEKSKGLPFRSDRE